MIVAKCRRSATRSTTAATFTVTKPLTRPLTLVVLALIFCALRLIGLDHGDPPVMFHADERHYAGVAARMSWDDLDPHRFENPPLLTYALFGASEVRSALWGEQSTRRWINQGGLYRLSRILAALLGAATAFVVAAAARRLAGDRAGLAALFLVGFSFLHGRDSHFGVNDVPMTFLVAVVTWMSLRVLAGDGLRWAWGAAVMAGLAAATKYNGAIAMALPVLALALSRERPRRWRLCALGLPLASLLAFVMANPYALLSWDDFSAGVANQYTRWGDNPAWGQSRDALPVLYGRATLVMVGGTHAVALLWGVALVVGKSWRTAAVLLAFPLLYLAGMLTKSLFFWRFVLPLLPALAVLAALGWESVLGWLERLATKGSGEGAPADLGEQEAAALQGLDTLQASAAGPGHCSPWVAAVLICASAWPATQLVRFNQLLAMPPTWMEARDWIMENAPRGQHVFAAGLPPSLPPAWTMHSLSVHLSKLHNVTDPKSGLPLIERGGLVIANSWTGRGGELEETAADRAAFLARLDDEFELVAEFSPGPHGDPEPYLLDSLYAPLVDLWRIERPGHTLKIYRVPAKRWMKTMVAGL